MVKPEEIIIDVLRRASIRIHWAFLVSLIVCAIVAASVYSSEYSYNTSLVKAAQIFIINTEEELEKIEKDNYGNLKILKPNGQYAEVAPLSYWNQTEIEKYSELTFRQKRAFNTLNNAKFESAQIPLVSQSISLSEIDLFGGVILIVLSMWIYFSMSQIVNILENEKTLGLISDNMSYIKYIFMTVHFRVPGKAVIITLLVILLPTIVLGFSTYILFGYWDIVHSTEYKNIIRKPYLISVGLRFFITLILLWFGVLILAGWIEISRKFNRHGQ